MAVVAPRPVVESVHVLNELNLNPRIDTQNAYGILRNATASEVPVPHFGLALKVDEWKALADRLRSDGTDFIVEPTLRFEGEPGEQWTMFFKVVCLSIAHLSDLICSALLCSALLRSCAFYRDSSELDAFLHCVFVRPPVVVCVSRALFSRVGPVGKQPRVQGHGTPRKPLC